MTHPMIAAAATKAAERLDALQLRGKKADDDAIGFLAGFATALQLADREDDAQAVLRWLVLVVTVRGAIEVRKTAIEAKAAQAPAPIALDQLGAARDALMGEMDAADAADLDARRHLGAA